MKSNHWWVAVLCMIAGTTSILVGLFMASETGTRTDEPKSEFAHCKQIYLDVGSNIGVQIRKLFEPSRYPNAEVLPIFDQYFGTNRKHSPGLCAIGIEMNPTHTMRLSTLEKHYTQSCGYSVRFFKETAASTHNGWVDFWQGLNRSNTNRQFIPNMDN